VEKQGSVRDQEQARRKKEGEASLRGETRIRSRLRASSKEEGRRSVPKGRNRNPFEIESKHGGRRKKKIC
jgi:hypothetical protein